MCTFLLLTQQLFDCFYVYIVVFKYVLLKGLNTLVLLNLNTNNSIAFITNWSQSLLVGHIKIRSWVVIEVYKHFLTDEILTRLKHSKRLEQFPRTLKAIENEKQNKILTIKKIEQKKCRKCGPFLDLIGRNCVECVLVLFINSSF